MTPHSLVTDIPEMKYNIAALEISKLVNIYAATQTVSVCERYMCRVRAVKNDVYLYGKSTNAHF
jgi:hypothetical protein